MAVSIGDTPLPAAPAPPGMRGLLSRAGCAVVRASLHVSARPMAMLIRGELAAHDRELGRALLAQAPGGIVAAIDEQYGPGPDELLDVYAPAEPAEAGQRLPAVVWTHGGAWLGGSKEALDGYLRRLAHAGFAVVGLRYSLAPEARYPTPVRQVFGALRYLMANARRLHVDPSRVLLAGDSAGAQISAQVAAIATNPAYAAEMGIQPTIAPEQLRGVALCCGIYDFAGFPESGPFARFLTTAGWCYSGTRGFRTDERFIASISVARHLTGEFPPTFLSAGNADPLAPQSAALADALRAAGVDVETLFLPAGHRPPLGHEYQFDLGLDDGRAALKRLTAFLERCASERAIDLEAEGLRC